MSWDYVNDPTVPLMRWQTRLTAEHPDAGLQMVGKIHDTTVQVEGVFGTAAVELRGSNSGQATVPLDVLRLSNIVEVRPSVCYFGVRVLDADETTDLLVTLVGRR